VRAHAGPCPAVCGVAGDRWPFPGNRDFNSHSAVARTALERAGQPSVAASTPKPASPYAADRLSLAQVHQGDGFTEPYD
jgi:hypothetical protein